MNETVGARSSAQDAPELSIIVAASNARRTLAECLEAIESQTNGRAVQVLVPTATAAEARLVREKFPRVIALESDQPRLIPELWGLAVPHARGKIIALTVASCIPNRNWIDEILRAHRADHAAVGGAIENAPGASLVDWAIYFVRYTPFMLPFREGPVIEVPGDNGAYKRAAIADQLDWIARRGFWETEINAKLRAQKETLWGDPRVVVAHKQSFTFLSFTQQRFEHGRIFGRTRGAKSSPIMRAFYLLSAPAVPLVFLARITRNLARKKRHLREFALSLPLTLWFLLAWATGEFLGLLGGARE